MGGFVVWVGVPIWNLEGGIEGLGFPGGRLDLWLNFCPKTIRFEGEFGAFLARNY
jgi:hypothetical protein